MFKISI